MPPKPKELDALAPLLRVRPIDATLLLPRDGELWIANFSPMSSLVNQALDRRPRPGGHVPNLPPPPPGACYLVLTLERLVVVTARASGLFWAPENVWASFNLPQISGLWHADQSFGYKQVHLTITDGNHWEFSTNRGSLKRYQEFEATVLDALGMAPRA